jgi:hypothetical protein
MKTKSKWKSLLGVSGSLLLLNCQPRSHEHVPVSARALADEYEQSTAAVRRKYDGKEIVVRGYTGTSASLPGVGADQGSVLLEEKEGKSYRQVVCWFSSEQVSKFSEIRGQQYIIVQGVFNGEAGADLKFCTLLKIE